MRHFHRFGVTHRAGPIWHFLLDLPHTFWWERSLQKFRTSQYFERYHTNHVLYLLIDGDKIAVAVPGLCLDSWSVRLSSMGHFFSDIWFLKSHPYTRPSSWLPEKTPGCQERYWYSLRAPRNRSDARFFLLILQMHHTNLERFTFFKHSYSWEIVRADLHQCKKKKIKDSAGSDNTASMIKGGGYVGARTAQTITKKLMWIRGVVCRSTRTRSLTVVAWVILQCIPCFMSADACLMEFSFSLWVSFLILW